MNSGTKAEVTVGIITVSDRASKGVYPDLGGPAVAKACDTRGWKVVARTLVADEIGEIRDAVRAQVAAGCQLILSTGGTGVSLRDVTPEAVRALAVRELPGFGEAMRMESLKTTPHALLSRSMAVVVGKSLVVCLPGKPTAAVECLDAVAAAIPHCVRLLQEPINARSEAEEPKPKPHATRIGTPPSHGPGGGGRAR